MTDLQQFLDPSSTFNFRRRDGPTFPMSLSILTAQTDLSDFTLIWNLTAGFPTCAPTRPASTRSFESATGIITWTVPPLLTGIISTTSHTELTLPRAQLSSTT